LGKNVKEGEGPIQTTLLYHQEIAVSEPPKKAQKDEKVKNAKKTKESLI